LLNIYTRGYDPSIADFQMAFNLMNFVMTTREVIVGYLISYESFMKDV